MPVFDLACHACDYYTDFWLAKRHDAPNPRCPQCGGETYRAWRGRMATIIRDEFVTPLVDDVMGPTTQVFHTKSEHRRAMKAAGLQQLDRHVGAPGSDRSKHTTRWF
jgi:hypothetical protein